MNRKEAEKLKVNHDFVVDHASGERSSKIVLLLTAVTMVVEIIAGTLFGSMALLADGWHMMTHVAAFSITLFAYAYARKHKNNPEFSFSTGKVGVLGGFASAVALGVVALMMGIESVERLIDPGIIQFDQAIVVAIIGLIVNGVSVFLLHGNHSHDHGEHDHHEHHHHHHDDAHHHDHNLKAAYFHVLADTLTSVLAIAALLIGKWLGWRWPDPVMGIVGGLVILKWAAGLMKQTSKILLDRSSSEAERTAVQQAIEADGGSVVTDLHIWKVSPQHSVVILSIATNESRSPQGYKHLLDDIGRFSHISIEVNQLSSL